MLKSQKSGGLIKMDQKKLTAVLSDKDFAEKIVKLQTPEEVQAAFKEKGIKISPEEVQLLGSFVNKMVEKGISELSEEDIKEVTGGGEKWMQAKADLGNMGMGTFVPLAMVMAVFNPHSTREHRALGVGFILSVAGIVAASHTIVPWGYKKIKDNISS